MTTKSDSSPLPHRHPRKLLVRRTIRIIGFAGLCLITLFFLAIAVENWRGKRAWDRYRSQLEAQGEQVYLATFAPNPVPPEANFCATPVFAALGDGQTNELRTSQSRIDLELGSGEADQPPERGSFEQATFEDYKAWRQFYRGNTNYPQANASLSDAEAVLVALGKYDAVIAELKNASRRPYAVLLLDHGDPTRLSSELLPLLARFKGVTQLLRFHASTLLEAGRSVEALEDLEVCFRIEEALGNDPLLISQLVRMAVVQIMMQPIWEGLAKQRWDESQLTGLQNRLASIDFLTSFQQCMRGERAFGNAMCETYRDSSLEQPHEDQSDAPEGAAMRLINLAPKGWLYQNQVACNRLFQEMVFPVVSPAEHRIYLDRQRELERWPDDRRGGVYTVLARMLSPAISKVSFKFARSQSTIDLAAVACALERYRIAEGKYPASLDALTPRFLESLPPDVINGEPLNYRRNEDGVFALYSIGLNEVDDGGVIGLSEHGTVHYDQGDKVWHYPDSRSQPQ